MEKYTDKTKTYEDNPYSGILVNSLAISIISFILMQGLFTYTQNPLFSLENSINIAFTAAVICPMFMWMSVFKELKRYEAYENSIEDCIYKCPVSILVNRGYMFVNRRGLFLVFASKKPYFVSSIKSTDVVKVTFYDKCYVNIRMTGRASSATYDIKFKIEGNVANTQEVLTKLFSDKIEDKNI